MALAAPPRRTCRCHHPVQADVPATISHQGLLTDEQGLAVPDGEYDLTARLYDVPSGGSSL